MNIYIHKNTFGFQSHLILVARNDLRKTTRIPDNEPLVFGSNTLTEIASLYNRKLPTFPPEEFKKPLKTILGSSALSDVPWHLTIPQDVLKRLIEAFAVKLWDCLQDLDLSYYFNHYRPRIEMLENMERARIDPIAWRFHSLNQELVTPHVFKTFEPDAQGYAKKIEYSTTETKTGRLRVVSGPHILNLPKEQRNILQSRFGAQGRILQLDYQSLEPRVLLSLKNLPSSLPGYLPLIEVGVEDIYLDVLKKSKIENIPRELVKEVTLSQLYGRGYEKLKESLHGLEDPDGFIDVVEEYFGIKEIIDFLLKEYELNNRQFILNFYGRPLDTTDAKPYMLLNYYIQSTAVDVALHGFNIFFQHIKHNKFIIPLFLLHDAFILDVHKDGLEELRKLKDLCSRNIPNFSGVHFPVKLSRF